MYKKIKSKTKEVLFSPSLLKKMRMSLSLIKDHYKLYLWLCCLTQWQQLLQSKLPFRCMNMLGSKTKETVLHGRANLFITTKLNFPLTAPCSAILGVLLSVTYGGAGRDGGEGVGGGGRAENVNRNSKCEREGLPN